MCGSDYMVEYTNNIKPIWIKTLVLSLGTRAYLGKCLNLFTPQNTHLWKGNEETSLMAVLWGLSKGHAILLTCLINSQTLVTSPRSCSSSYKQVCLDMEEKTERIWI